MGTARLTIILIYCPRFLTFRYSLSYNQCTFFKNLLFPYQKKLTGRGSIRSVEYGEKMVYEL